MAHTLQIDKPIGAAVRHLARKLVAVAERDLARAAEGAPVHAARRSLKRLRSLVRLIRPAIGKEQARDSEHRLKDASDLLAGTRQREALTAAVGKLALDPSLVESLSAAVIAAHKTDASLTGSDGVIVRARGLLACQRKDIKRWPLPKTDHGFCLEGLGTAYGRARKSIGKALEGGEAKALHDARRDVIHNLHHLDMLTGLWPALITPWVAELNGLREALGDFNDLEELKAVVADLPETMRAEAGQAIATAQQAHVARARLLARRLYAEKEKAFTARLSALWDRPPA